MDIRPRETYDHGPVGPALDLSRVTGVDLHHTAGGWGTDVHADLKALADQTRTKFGRSSYNHAIHPHIPDVVWEMQGLHVGAHNDGENSTRIGLVVLGNYQNTRPPDRIVTTVGRFVGHAHYSGWTTRPHVKGHRDTDATACPGRWLYARLDDIRSIALEDDMPLTDDDVSKVADAVFARIWGTPVGGQDFTYGQAIGRIYRKVHSQQAGNVDAETLAGLKVLADLGRKLSG